MIDLGSHLQMSFDELTALEDMAKVCLWETRMLLDKMTGLIRMDRTPGVLVSY